MNINHTQHCNNSSAPLTTTTQPNIQQAPGPCDPTYPYPHTTPKNLDHHQQDPTPATPINTSQPRLQPTSAHRPVAKSPPTVPQRAAVRQLQHQHRVHNIAAHYANQHPKRKAEMEPAPTHEASPTTNKRRLHASPPSNHPARFGAKAARVTTLADTIAPLSQEELVDILTETQSKYNKHVPTRGLMYPGPIAQAHPAGPLLRKFGTEGCPVDIIDDWTLQQLDQAVAYGAHPSAETPEAAQALRAEALEKVQQKFAKLVPWKQLRRHILEGRKKHTKISPIAAIPHKSRLFRMILDLSSKGQCHKGHVPTKSVNELTNEDAAPMQSMNQLGKTLGRIIYAVATCSTDQGPILFCKLDIKDGFWRMVVPEDVEEQFCYVLPQLPGASPDEEIMIVVPAALQMGWKSSPPFFCAATETGRDVAEWLRQQAFLPPHPLEKHMMDSIDPTLLERFPFPDLSQHPDPAQARQQFFHLFEVYVDDYIGALQATDPEVLRHHSRALLHAIHQIFPPPAATGHDGEDPISYKKLVLEGEGIWDVRKEILGWIFDGLHRTMQLPEQKVQNLRESIRQTIRSGHIDTKAFESFIGKCQHACLGIPGGTALLPPLYKALHSALNSGQRSVQIHKHSQQYHALRDLQTIFKVLGKHPIQCCQLVPGQPAYIGHCDACKYGVGGIWMSGTKTLRPIVWRLKWPQDIVDRVAEGTITINDLEMAGLLLHYLILEQLVDMTHLHTAAWCDNTSAVTWTTRMSSSTSLIGQQLTRALALRMLINQSSHLAALSIAGLDNSLADLASRSFKQTGVNGNYNLTDTQFLTKFNTEFPLQQEASWLMLRLRDSISSRVFTLLRGKTAPTASWLRLSESGCDIGLTGSTSAMTSMEWTPFSKELKSQLRLQSWQLSPVTSVKGMLAEDIESALAQFRMRFAPLARSSNWLSDQTRPTKRMRMSTTGSP